MQEFPIQSRTSPRVYVPRSSICKAVLGRLRPGLCHVRHIQSDSVICFLTAGLQHILGRQTIVHSYQFHAFCNTVSPIIRQELIKIRNKKQ